MQHGWTAAIQQRITQSYPSSNLTQGAMQATTWMDGSHPAIRQQQQATTSINADLPKVPCKQRRGWMAARVRRSRPREASIHPSDNNKQQHQSMLTYPRSHAGNDMYGRQPGDGDLVPGKHPSIHQTTTSNNINQC